MKKRYSEEQIIKLIKQHEAGMRWETSCSVSEHESYFVNKASADVSAILS